MQGCPGAGGWAVADGGRRLRGGARLDDWVSMQGLPGAGGWAMARVPDAAGLPVSDGLPVDAAAASGVLSPADA